MKNTSEIINSIIYTNRDMKCIYEELSRFVSLGDSVEHILNKTGLEFSGFNPHLGIADRLTCRTCGIWIQASDELGVVNIVREEATLNGVTYPSLPIAQKETRSTSSEKAEQELNKITEILERIDRRKKPFFQQVWSAIKRE